jgi:predicted ATP-dependent protease
MLAGIILIDTEGAAVGKCNGLTVLEWATRRSVCRAFRHRHGRQRYRHRT